MKDFPFKILFICVLFPPLLYVLSIQGLEAFLEKREFAAVNSILIRDQQALFEGRYSIREEVNRNIADYLKQSIKYNLGIETNILVKTKDDRVLYPARFSDDIRELDKEDVFSRLPEISLNYMEMAAENFEILNEGLIVSVDLKIRHNSWLSNSLLLLYVFLSAVILRAYLRKGVKAAEKQGAEKEILIRQLTARLLEFEETLSAIREKEKQYMERIESLRKEKEDLSIDIDELLGEIEKMESGLKEQEKLKEETELEAFELQAELERMKEKSKKPKQRKKKNDTIIRRFRVLYKNLSFSDRAIEGFAGLPEEFQLKAEEVIHRLNQDESLVSVKRKVFGKGGKMNILETDFAYSGRLYFQKNAKSVIRIIAIGTKNTQEKDLTYLGGLT